MRCLVDLVIVHLCQSHTAKVIGGGSPAESNRGHATLAPITPGVMRTKLELQASNAIAGMLLHECILNSLACNYLINLVSVQHLSFPDEIANHRLPLHHTKQWAYSDSLAVFSPKSYYSCLFILTVYVIHLLTWKWKASRHQSQGTSVLTKTLPPC